MSVRRIALLLGTCLVATVVPAAPALADSGVVTFGYCEPSPYNQAPGQTGNGPLTIVNGKVILPPAFAGGQGCAK